MWVELKIPVPPKLAELCGYPGGARHVGLCWQPSGDESSSAAARRTTQRPRSACISPRPISAGGSAGGSSGG